VSFFLNADLYRKTTAPLAVVVFSEESPEVITVTLYPASDKASTNPMAMLSTPERISGANRVVANSIVRQSNSMLSLDVCGFCKQLLSSEISTNAYSKPNVM